MNSLDEFFKGLISIVKLELNSKNLNITEQQQIISKINEYLFTNYVGIGTTHILDSDFEYFSEFHKYWEKNHRKILNPQIDDYQCDILADVLHNIYLKYGKTPFSELYDTLGLNKSEICRVRYFTANQEFRGTRNFEDFARIYQRDPAIFDTNYIYRNPEEFLSHLRLGTLSQSDKRIKYAKISAELLIENRIEPIELLELSENDFLILKKKLTNTQGSGYGKKKTDMFLRDMRLLDVWSEGRNFDKIDVASDINTIKVALRSSILKTDILLLSSFLDIFCYQYGLIDEMNAKAWRQVWEIWNNKYPEECIESPCLMDYLIYRLIGKEICKEKLCLFKCDEVGHEFFWHSSRNRSCQICYEEIKERRPASLIFKDLPCKHLEGTIFFEKNKQVAKFLPGITQCPFIIACKPNLPEFRKLNPPKSISILGRTGWQTAKTRRDEGGGGLMA